MNSFSIKPKKYSSILKLAITVSALLILWSTAVFYEVSARRIRQDNHQYLINDTKQLAGRIDDMMDEGLRNIRSLSGLISASLDSPKIEIARYQDIVDDSIFDYIEFVDRDGKNHTVLGNLTDASDRDYFRNAMKGESGIDIVFDSRATHENMMIFYAPLYFKNEIIGSLSGVYQASNKITKSLEFEYFGEQTETFLCTKDGTIFAGGHKHDVDVTKRLDIRDVLGSDIQKDKLSKAIAEGREAGFTINGGKSGGFITPLADHEWFLVQIFPTQINQTMIRQYMLLTLALVIVLIVIFAILSYVVISSDREQKRIIQTSFERLKAAKEGQEKELKMVQTLSGIYYSLHYVNIKQNTFNEYRAQNEVKMVLNHYDKASDGMKAVIKYTIADEHQEVAQKFTDLSTLPERMAGQKYISMDFHGNFVGWIRIAFITVSENAGGMPSEVIIATQRIDEQKKREEKLFHDANTDELTGLLNRRSYENDLSEYPKVPVENSYVYVSMDLNSLKVVNDTLGHEAGDELIRGACSIMKRCIGNYGRLYRTGGDEFAAQIYADPAQLEHIMHDFEEEQIRWKGKLVDQVSISAGYASKQEFPGATVEELATIAEKRMYEAKTLYYKKKGVDRRGQQAAHTALCALYDKILKVNLTEDTHQIVNMHPYEQSVQKGFSDKISQWLRNFALSGQVHEADVEEYLRKTDLDYLRAHFKQSRDPVLIIYQRKVSGIYRQATMEIIPADDYSDDNQSVFLYVKSVNGL